MIPATSSCLHKQIVELPCLDDLVALDSFANDVEIVVLEDQEMLERINLLGFLPYGHNKPHRI